MKKGTKVVSLFMLIWTLCMAFFSVRVEAATPKLNKTSVTIGIGEQTKLSVSGTKKTVKWSSSNKKVVTVSKGTVTGIKVGEATISAKVDGKTYKATVTVKDAGISETSLELVASQKKTLKVENVSGTVKWSSSNKKIATVDSKGKVKAKKAGKAIIKAKVGGVTYRCALTVKSSGMNKSKATIYTKNTVQLKVIGNSGNTTWTSSNKKIAKVNSKGKVTGVKSGKTTIKAKIGGKTYKCAITVKKPELAKKTISLDEGKTAQVKLNGAKIKSVKSSNKKIATVSKKGKVTAKKEGKCTITVTDTNKKTYKCKITVNGTGDINTNDIESPYLSTNAISIIKGEAYALTLNDNSKKVTWSSDNTGVATVGADGVVVAVGAGSATITATIKNGTYNCSVQVVEPGNAGATYTRGEWIHLLVEKMGVDKSLLGDDMIYYYSDTEGTTYGKDIEIAKYFSILPDIDNPEDVPVFEPDEMATREFAAMTTINALGYQCDGTMTLSCNDANEITYKDAVAIAIKKNMFVDVENAFRPADAVTDADRVRIWNVIEEINTSVNNITEHSHVVYADHVIVNRLKDFTDYVVSTDGNGTYNVVINNDKEVSYLKKGNTVVLPANAANPTGITLTLNADAKTSKNQVMFSGTVPTDASSVMTSIDYAGHGTINEDAITAMEGVTVTYDKAGVIDKPSGTANAKGASVDGEPSVDYELHGGVPLGTLTFDFGEGKKIGKVGTIKGAISVELPDITAITDVTIVPLEINEITLQLKEKVKISGSLEMLSVDSTDFGSFEIGRIPFSLGATGLSIDMVFQVYFEANGELAISYYAEFLQGVQYKDGDLRFLGTCANQSLELPKLGGSAQLGLKLAANLTLCGVWDLIGVDGKAGPAVEASITNHADAGICCVDGTIYVMLDVELNPETILGEFAKKTLHYTLSKSFWDSGSSPFRLGVHFENMHRVESCTYGQGGIEGHIFEAGSWTPIEGARVMAYQGSSLKKSVFTDVDGNYKLDGLDSGYYTLKVSATGYKTFSDEEIIRANEITYAEIFMMVGQSDTRDGRVNGYVYNAVDGSTISANYAVREGWNNRTGEILGTGTASQKYAMTLEPGNYTLEFSADGYVTSYINVVVISDATTNANVTLSPKAVDGLEGELRIVLTWGETPRDLDSHLFGPTVDGTGRFHVNFSSKKYSENGLVYADLDLDDVSSYGPETVTVYNMNETGTYSYYVHDYTNKYEDESTALSNSGAKVSVYVGNELYGVYNIPRGVGGTVWHIFDYDAATKTFKMYNTMTYSNGYLTDETIRAGKNFGNYELYDILQLNSLEEKTSDTTEEQNTVTEEQEAGSVETGSDEFDLDESSVDELNDDMSDGEEIVSDQTASGESSGDEESSSEEASDDPLDDGLSSDEANGTE